MAKLSPIEIPCPHCGKVQQVPLVVMKTETRVRGPRGNDVAIVTVKPKTVQHMCEGQS